MSLSWFSKVFCKLLVIREGSASNWVFCTRERCSFPRFYLEQGCSMSAWHQTQETLCAVQWCHRWEGVLLNIPWFHTEEGAVCKYLLILYVGGDSEHSINFTDERESSMLYGTTETKNPHKYDVTHRRFGSSLWFNTQASAQWVSGDSVGLAVGLANRLRKESWGEWAVLSKNAKAKAQSP